MSDSSVVPLRQMRTHLAWKERQVFTPVTVLLGAVFLVSLVVAVISGSGRPGMELDQTLCLLFIIATCIAGLALGVMAFSVERDLETDGLLDAFPIEDRVVGRVKLTQATLHFFAFFVLAFCFAAAALFLVKQRWLAFEGLSEGKISLTGFLLIAAVPVECFLWSLVASQRIGNPIYATAAAAVLSLVGAILANFLPELLGIRVAQSNVYLTVLPCHLLLVGVLSWVVWEQGGRWLRSHSAMARPSIFGSVSERARTMTRSGATIGDVRSKMRRPTYPWKALMWQHLHQQRWALGLCGALLLLYSWLIALLAVEQQLLQFMLRANFVMATVIGVVLGLSSFAFDQMQRRYMFFQQQGGYPIRLWFSRLSLVLLAIPLLKLLSAWAGLEASQAFLNWERDANLYYQFASNGAFPIAGHEAQQLKAQLAGAGPILVFVGVAGICQLVSALARSGVVLIIVGIATGILWGIGFSYLSWLGDSLWLVAWPLALLPYACSLLYSGWFVRGSRAVIASVTCSVMLVSAVAVSLLALRSIRLNVDYPSDRLGELSQRWDGVDDLIRSDSERYSAALDLRMAMAELDSMNDLRANYRGKFGVEAVPAEEETDEAFQAFVAEQIKAPSRKIVEAIEDPKARYFLNQNSAQLVDSQCEQIRNAVLSQTTAALKSGNLRESLELLLAQVDLIRFESRAGNEFATGFVKWIYLEGQTDELLEEAANDLEQRFRAVFDREDNLILEGQYFLIQHQARRYREASVYSTVDLPQFDWEIERSEKLAIRSIFDRNNTRVWTELCGLLDQERSVAQLQRAAYSTRLYEGNLGRQVKADHTTLPLITWQNEVDIYVRWLRAFRYVELRLALERYRRQNDRYPESLEQLEGPYLDQVPVDPLVGGEFFYQPKGVDEPCGLARNALLQNLRPVVSVDWIVPAGKPFLLSSSAGLIRGKFELAKPIEGSSIDDNASRQPRNPFGSLLKVNRWPLEIDASHLLK